MDKTKRNSNVKLLTTSIATKLNAKTNKIVRMLTANDTALNKYELVDDKLDSKWLMFIFFDASYLYADVHLELNLFSS